VMKRWYVGYFYHGYTKQLYSSFEINKKRFKDVKFWHPMIEEVRIKDGCKVIVKVPLFDEYALFNFEETSSIWYDIVKYTPISKFLKGKDGLPIPLEQHEVDRLFELTQQKRTVKYSHLINKTVIVTDGPYKGFIGQCKSIIKGRYKARVRVNLGDIATKDVEIGLEGLQEIE
jgi:transcriptional antiterminator NusG